MHAAARHGTPRLTSLPKDDEVRCEVRPPRSPIWSLIPGRGVHNMLRVRVCAAHMGGFLGPKFSKQGSLFP